MQTEISTLTSLLESFADDPDFVSAFARGLIIFQILSKSRKPLTISDISKLTNFPRATVRRALHTLVQLGYVEQEDRYFVLTSKILMLSHSFITSQPLPNAAQPILENITKEVDEASSMAVLTQNQIIYIARSSENTQRIMSNSLAIGSQLPAYCTSMGRVLLAALPEEKQKYIIYQSKPKPYTENTIYAEIELLQELKKVEEQGFAIINQELEIGLCSIAVPVFDKSGKIIAAINISTHALRTTPEEMLDKFLPILQRSASLLKTFL